MLGNATVSYVSGYQRNRVKLVQLYAYETRPLVAKFYGAIPKDALIVNALWQTWQASNVVMSNPEIIDDQKSTSIDILAQVGGCAIIKCTVTLDTGAKLVQQFRVEVDWAPIYTPGQWAIGPYNLSVDAP